MRTLIGLVCLCVFLAAGCGQDRTIDSRATLTTEQLRVRAETGEVELQRLAERIDSSDYQPGDFDRFVALRERVIADYRELECRKDAQSRKRVRAAALAVTDTADDTADTPSSGNLFEGLPGPEELKADAYSGN